MVKASLTPDSITLGSEVYVVTAHTRLNTCGRPYIVKSDRFVMKAIVSEIKFTTHMDSRDMPEKTVVHLTLAGEENNESGSPRWRYLEDVPAEGVFHTAAEAQSYLESTNG